MKITIEIEADVDGRLPHVEKIRSVLNYALAVSAARELEHLGVKVIREPDISIDHDRY